VEVSVTGERVDLVYVFGEGSSLASVARSSAFHSENCWMLARHLAEVVEELAEAIPEGGKELEGDGDSALIPEVVNPSLLVVKDLTVGIPEGGGGVRGIPEGLTLAEVVEELKGDGDLGVIPEGGGGARGIPEGGAGARGEVVEELAGDGDLGLRGGGHLGLIPEGGKDLAVGIPEGGGGVREIPEGGAATGGYCEEEGTLQSQGACGEITREPNRGGYGEEEGTRRASAVWGTSLVADGLRVEFRNSVRAASQAHLDAFQLQLRELIESGEVSFGAPASSRSEPGTSGRIPAAAA